MGTYESAHFGEATTPLPKCYSLLPIGAVIIRERSTVPFGSNNLGIRIAFCVIQPYIFIAWYHPEYFHLLSYFTPILLTR